MGVKRVIMAAWNVMELGLGERKRIIFYYYVNVCLILLMSSF